ncbi:MAG: DUF433 domain-containing protein, partial [Armatimonadetes bacterium]|nr:DUF433 domain-containing protein [Armatimonadota bacterium]
LGLPAHGAAVDEILEEYEELTEDDVRACFLLAVQDLERRFLFGTSEEATSR